MKLLEKIEAALQKINCYKLASCLHYFQQYYESAESQWIQLEWALDCYNELNKGFAMLQHEIYLKEEVAAHVKVSELRPLTSEEAAELRA